MKKIYVIAFFGKSGAGKDTLLDRLAVTGLYNKITMTTTRPMRDYEIDGVHYNFTDPVSFAEKVLNGDFVEATSFNDWFYGTDIHELKEDMINVGAFSIHGIECMLEDPRLEVFPVYVMATDKTRLLRNLNREDNPNCHEICRRYFTDDKDFCDIPFEYYPFNNNNDGDHINRIHEFIKQIQNDGD